MYVELSQKKPSCFSSVINYKQIFVLASLLLNGLIKKQKCNIMVFNSKTK